jgi:hypothetical protein
VDYLINAMKVDFLPNPLTPDYTDFGFVNLKTDEDQSKLFSLYTGLIKGLQCDLDGLHQACMKGRLVAFIDQHYLMLPSEDRGKYYPWFCKNKAMVHNRYTPLDVRVGATNKHPYEPAKNSIEAQWRK